MNTHHQFTFPTSSFNIALTPQLIFGGGSISKLGKLCKLYGEGILLVTGGKSYQKSQIKQKVEAQLKPYKHTVYQYTVSGEPSPEVIDEAIMAYRNKGIQIIIAIGGGSVMDAGKAIAAMMQETESVINYLEGVGTISPSGKRLPLIAVPTTSGTGSEATKNAVITQQGGNGFKKSLRHDNYIPDIALIDPELSISCMPLQTAASGMDAFTQLLESYLSTKANAYTDTLAMAGLQNIAYWLEKAVSDGSNIRARSSMAYAAYLSGICLANAGLGLIHGFAQPLGSLFPIPHGIVCGSLMGIVNRITVTKLRNTDPHSQYLQKYANVGRLFNASATEPDNFYVDSLIEKIEYYINKFQIPNFSKYGVQELHIDMILNETSHKNHPVKLNTLELNQILKLVS